MFIFRYKDSPAMKGMGRKNSDGGARPKPKGPTTPRYSPVRGPTTPRYSPVRGPTSQRYSPARGPHASPTGTGHYAGCKWSEPPLPSALPPPPQHWMQAPPHSHVLPFRQPKIEQHDNEKQLKVLLKVQA